jgi:hypothetical protein
MLSTESFFFLLFKKLIQNKMKLIPAQNTRKSSKLNNEY